MIEQLKELRYIEKPTEIGGTRDIWTLKSYDKHRCIFVHIPKTAGLSVAKSLFGNAGGSHIPLYSYFEIFGIENFNSYFKFAFVRNPWDRLISAYWFLIAGGGQSEHDRLLNREISKYRNFKDFVKYWLVKTEARDIIYFIPQYKFVCLDDETVSLDFVGYFEHLARDFQYVSSLLGISCTLQYLNASSHSDYREHYDDETIGIVASLYYRDIELFNYDFDNRNV